MKYIITGGAGFIGSHLAEELVKRRKKVVIIDNLATGNIKNLDSIKTKVEFIHGDILDISLLKKTFGKNDIIFHQAALPSVARSIQDPLLSNRVNVEGTLNVLVAARDNKAKRVIFASSSSVYGDSVKLPKTESMCINPKSPYALTKFTAETYMRLFYKLYGLETVSLRYFNVFGPRQDPTSQYSAVIPRFITMIKEGKSPIIFGDGKQSRDFTYVANVVNANILASESKIAPGEFMNVACGERFTLLRLLKELEKIIGKKANTIFSDERKGDVKHSLADIRKAKELIGYDVKVKFTEGLKITARSF